MDARDDEQLHAVLLEQLAEDVHRARFVAEIEFLGDLRAQADDERDHVVRLIDAARRHEADEAFEDADIGRDGLLDIGTEHLDGDGRAVEQRRAVDDGDRCGGERRLVELREHFLERASELRLDDGAHLRERHGGGGIEAAAELLGDVFADDAGRGGDELAELHVGGAEALEDAAAGVGCGAGAADNLAGDDGRHVPRAEGGHAGEAADASESAGAGEVDGCGGEHFGALLRGHAVHVIAWGRGNGNRRFRRRLTQIDGTMRRNRDDTDFADWVGPRRTRKRH